MYTRTLISLAGSILVTAAIVGGLAATSQPTRTAPAPTMIDGIPVVNLPAVTVTASVPKATTSSRTAGKRTVALADTHHPFSRLIESAAAQVANSHLSMPYYSFSSSIGQAGRD